MATEEEAETPQVRLSPFSRRSAYAFPRCHLRLQDTSLVLRTLGNLMPRTIKWRSIRPYLLVDRVSFTPAPAAPPAQPGEDKPEPTVCS